MKLINLFKRNQMFHDYKSSTHSLIYEKIARDLNNSAQHVYEIAHGKSVVCYDDLVIQDRLYMHGIIQALCIEVYYSQRNLAPLG